jgi:hypothetical protein
MKVAFIFGPGGANEDPAGMISLYERNSQVRQAYDEVAGLSGIDVDVLLRKKDRQGDRNVALVNFISLAAGMLGIHDALCALDVSPSVIGGMSMGGTVGSCVAGALPRPTLIDILQCRVTDLLADSGQTSGFAQGAAQGRCPEHRQLLAFRCGHRSWVAGAL